MNSLANFFDHPLEKKISAAEIPSPEIQLPEKYFGLDSVNRITGCPCELLWLDAYGTWRCKKCFPPIFESEVRELKKRSEENPPAKISPVENFSIENSSAEEISNVNFLPRYFFNDEFLWSLENPDNQEPPCDTCGSLAFWWNIPGDRFCQRCQPRSNRSRELIELASKFKIQARLAKTTTPAKK